MVGWGEGGTVRLGILNGRWDMATSVGILSIYSVDVSVLVAVK